MNFGATLRRTRIQKDMTQRELGEATGVTTVTIGNWERGVRLPSFELLAKLADALDTNADVLLGRENYGEIRKDSRTGTLIDQFQALDEHGKTLVETVCRMEFERAHPRITIRPKADHARYLPYYDSPSAAGFAAPLGGGEFATILAEENVPKRADYAVRISGDSMEPYIHDGDIVFVEQTEELNVGEVGIFCVDGAMYCKQYSRDNDGNLCLRSANPARVDANVFVPKESSSTVRCFGRVLLEQAPPAPAEH